MRKSARIVPWSVPRYWNCPFPTWPQKRLRYAWPAVHTRQLCFRLPQKSHWWHFSSPPNWFVRWKDNPDRTTRCSSLRATNGNFHRSALQCLLTKIWMLLQAPLIFTSFYFSIAGIMKTGIGRKHQQSPGLFSPADLIATNYRLHNGIKTSFRGVQISRNIRLLHHSLHKAITTKLSNGNTNMNQTVLFS